jgi:DNA polymerase-4
MAQAIRAEVQAQTGITVSMGVAPNKFLAKIASDWNKPDGLMVIVPDVVADFVAELPVERLHGVGRRTTERLHAQGLFTCRDIRARSLLDMMAQFGALGQRLYELAHGRDERPVTPDSIRKSVSTEQTFPEDLTDLTQCMAQLPALLADLDHRFERLDQYRIQGAFVKLKFSDFTQTTVERALVVPEIAVFNDLLAEGWARKAMPVRLLGVGYRLRHTELLDPLQMELPFVR